MRDRIFVKNTNISAPLLTYPRSFQRSGRSNKGSLEFIMFGNRTCIFLTGYFKNDNATFTLLIELVIGLLDLKNFGG